MNEAQAIHHFDARAEQRRVTSQIDPPVFRPPPNASILGAISSPKTKLLSFRRLTSSVEQRATRHVTKSNGLKQAFGLHVAGRLLQDTAQNARLLARSRIPCFSVPLILG